MASFLDRPLPNICMHSHAGAWGAQECAVRSMRLRTAEDPSSGHSGDRSAKRPFDPKNMQSPGVRNSTREPILHPFLYCCFACGSRRKAQRETPWTSRNRIILIQENWEGCGQKGPMRRYERLCEAASSVWALLRKLYRENWREDVRIRLFFRQRRFTDARKCRWQDYWGLIDGIAAKTQQFW